jgi:hypothetical protein
MLRAEMLRMIAMTTLCMLIGGGCASTWLAAGGYTVVAETDGTSASGWTAAAGSLKEGEGVTGSVQVHADHVEFEDAGASALGCELVMLLHTFRALGFSFGFGWAGHWTDAGDWGTGPTLNVGTFWYVRRDREVMLHLGARSYGWAGETDGELDTGARAEVMLRLIGVM